MDLTPMMKSRSWTVERGLLDIYILLVHRIQGLGWSLDDFWAADTWTTSLLYCMELQLIDEEEKELKKGKRKSSPEKFNDDKAEKTYGMMFNES